MRRIAKPTDDASAVFLTCTSRIADPDLKLRLASLKPEVIAAASAFDAAATGGHIYTLPRQATLGSVVTPKEMMGLYDAQMVPKRSPGRELYDRLKASARFGICPLCGQRPVSTLDHYLPQTLFLPLVVVPINLVPCCADCNKRKRNLVAATAGEQTLHPYFDHVDDAQWLKAIVHEERPVALNFVVSRPDNWDLVKFERVGYHFALFGLAELYASQAAGELADIQYSMSRLLARAGASTVQQHLKEESASRMANHLNSWQTAMYQALATSEWYCSGGFE